MHFWLQIIFRCMTSKLWVGHSSSNFLITIKVGRAAAIATDAASLSSTKRSFGSFRNANDFLSYRTLRKPSHLRMVFDFTSRKRFGGPSEIFEKITILIIRNKPIWTHLPSMHVAPGGPSTWRTKKCKKNADTNWDLNFPPFFGYLSKSAGKCKLQCLCNKWRKLGNLNFLHFLSFIYLSICSFRSFRTFFDK